MHIILNALAQVTVNFIFIAIIQGSIDYKKSVANYKRATADFEKYQRDEVNRIEAEEIRERYNQAHALKCPLCYSTNIEKITSVDRAISVGTVGLASGKIGKQYKCKRCKHMW